MKAIRGHIRVEAVEFPDNRILNVEGVFIELGSKGAFELAATLEITCDPSGFIETNRNQETNLPGVFAAGDVTGPPFQVAKVIGEGCVAGIRAADYVRQSSGENENKEGY